MLDRIGDLKDLAESISELDSPSAQKAARLVELAHLILEEDLFTIHGQPMLMDTRFAKSASDLAQECAFIVNDALKKFIDKQSYKIQIEDRKKFLKSL